MKHYIAMWQNWSNIHGRTTRKEFWTAFSIHAFILLLISIGAAIVNFILGASFGGDVFGSIFSIAGIICSTGGVIPLFSLYVRRLHDANIPLYVLLFIFILLGYLGVIVLFILLCLKSAPDNKYGVNSQKEKEWKE